MITAVMTLARTASGVRIVITPINGAFTRGPKNDDSASATTIAGTGTLDGTGKVGPIGGIQQKIAAARDAGAKLFMVPPDNCKDALGAPNGDMRLVKATTMHAALQALKAWDANHDATLPSCEEDS